MIEIGKASIAAVLATCGLFGWACNPAAADVRIEGQVQAGGGPLASSNVTLWAASSGEPRQLAQTTSGSDGSFVLSTPDTLGADVSLYLVAKGGQATVNQGSADNPAIALLTVLGNTPPAKVVINEMTTVASVWTNAQFLDGAALKGYASACASRLAMCRTSSLSKPAATAALSRTASTAPRHRRWRTSPRCPACSLAAPPASRLMLATACSPPRLGETARRPLTR